MGSKLLKEEYRALQWLSKHREPMWGGIYQQNGEGDSVVSYLLREGLIEGVACRHVVGKLHLEGGYVITPAGRAALEAQGGGE